MIIDCHCHAGKGDIMTAPWNTAAPLGAYLRRARSAGIKRTVVFPVFQSDYPTGNRDLARLVASLPSRLIGFAMVHAGRNAGQVRDMVQEAVLRHGFRGVKVHGSEHMPTREVCEAVREFKVPLLVDVAGKAHVIDMFAPEYPDVSFIIAHLGSFADDWRAHERVVEQLIQYPNVYADTSGVRRFDYLVKAVKRAGPHKVLFGSDGPWLHPGVELYKIRMLGLPVGYERLILGGNATRLILSSQIGRRAEICCAHGSICQGVGLTLSTKYQGNCALGVQRPFDLRDLS
jgi:predicted TIM-barrel fold metal-dependent hydrolase